ncbi:MAG: hypothetical protein NC093_02535 [Alistipes sp.]|nr:hypothetical protein [Alistipes sp.]
MSKEAVTYYEAQIKKATEQKDRKYMAALSWQLHSSALRGALTREEAKQLQAQRTDAEEKLKKE